MRTTETEF